MQPQAPRSAFTQQKKTFAVIYKKGIKSSVQNLISHSDSHRISPLGRLLTELFKSSSQIIFITDLLVLVCLSEIITLHSFSLGVYQLCLLFNQSEVLIIVG